MKHSRMIVLGSLILAMFAVGCGLPQPTDPNAQGQTNTPEERETPPRSRTENKPTFPAAHPFRLHKDAKLFHEGASDVVLKLPKGQEQVALHISFYTDATKITQETLSFRISLCGLDRLTSGKVKSITYQFKSGQACSATESMLTAFRSQFTANPHVFDVPSRKQQRTFGKIEISKRIDPKTKQSGYYIVLHDIVMTGPIHGALKFPGIDTTHKWKLSGGGFAKILP